MYWLAQSGISKLVESLAAVEGNYLFVTFPATNEMIAIFSGLSSLQFCCRRHDPVIRSLWDPSHSS
jgi:hypothetical protein